jgi:hypothetical protein
MSGESLLGLETLSQKYLPMAMLYCVQSNCVLEVGYIVYSELQVRLYQMRSSNSYNSEYDFSERCSNWRIMTGYIV